MLSKLWAAIKGFFELEEDEVHVFARVIEHDQGMMVYYWEVAVKSNDIKVRNSIQHSLYDQIADIYIGGVAGLPPGAGIEKFFDVLDCGIRSKHAFWTKEACRTELETLQPLVGKILDHHELLQETRKV